MKNILLIVLVVLVLPALSSAQQYQPPEEQLPTKPINMTKSSFELTTIQNGWQQSGGPYKSPLLFALVAQIVNTKLGGDVASSTREIIEEGFERDELANSRWVDKNSARLTEGTLKVAQWRIEIVTGGSSSGSKRDNLRVGDVSIGTEQGSSEAWIALTFKDLVTGNRVATIVGYSKYASVNVDDFRVRRSLFGIPFGNRIDWSSYDSDPVYRRGMISTARALKDLEKKLETLTLPNPRDGQ